MNRPYNPKCLVGNWYEDRVLEEDVIRDYLAGGRSQPENSNALPITLTTVNDGGVHFGDTILLKCDRTDENVQTTIAKAARQDCIIAGNFANAGDSVKAVGITAPVVSSSTALVVRSVDGSPEGSAVRFGQPFGLSTVDGRYYLQSNLRSYAKSSKVANLQEIEFVSVYTHECDWVVTCVNPKFRIEVEGRPVPANEKLVFLHMKTNKAIGVVTDMNNSSKFEIVCHTFLNSHKAEEDVNHWKFVTNVPGLRPY